MRLLILLLLCAVSTLAAQELIGSVSSRCPAGCRCQPVKNKNSTQVRGTDTRPGQGRTRGFAPSSPSGPPTAGARVKCGDLGSQVVSLAELEPSLFPRDTFQLDLGDNLITDIPRGGFAHLPLLQKLDLRHNQIGSLAVESFLNLSSLRRLDLSENYLTRLGGGVFLGLEKLTHLRLAKNQLTSIAEGAFDDLISLKNLDLSGNPLMCDCHLSWLVDWLGNESVKLTEGSQCQNPPHLQGQDLSGLTSSALLCRSTPIQISLEIKPDTDQVVFERDSLQLACILVGPHSTSLISWLWQRHKDPTQSFPDIRVDARFIAEQTATVSTLTINQLTSEHSGQWECHAGNLSQSVSLLVISSSTEFCPPTVTSGSKGSYTWPRSVVGTLVELPCAATPPVVAAASLARPKPGIPVKPITSVITPLPARASQLCGQSGVWQFLNTSTCAFLSDTTKALEQFAKLSLSKATALQSAQRLRNFTGEMRHLQDKMDVVFLARTVENHLEFITREKELGSLLVGLVDSASMLPTPLLQEAQAEDNACHRLVAAAETVAEHSPAPIIQSGMAVEALRVSREGFQGVTCVWYQDPAGKLPRVFHCSSSSLPSNTALHDMEMVASVQVPASLFAQLPRQPGSRPPPQLIVSMFTNARLFPETNASESWGITSCVVGCKLVGGEGEGAEEVLTAAPVWVTLRAPLDSLARPVVWDGRGTWAEQGCQLSRMLGSLLVFQCSRLGYFALKQDLTPPLITPLSPPALPSRISPPALYVGCLLIGTCLLISLVTYISCSRELHMSAKTKHSLVNTWLAMFLLSLIFSCGIHQTGDVRVCQGVGLALHYLSLCTLLWMTVTVSNLHKKLTAGDNIPEDEEDGGELPVHPQPMLGFYLVGWGIALIICGISGAVNMRHYAGPSYCFLGPTASVSAVLVPSAAILLVLAFLWLLAHCAASRRNSESGRISQGTQATERVDLELLSPRPPSPCLSSSSSSCSSVDDPERSPRSQLLAHFAVLVLFLAAWSSGAAAVAPASLPHQAIIFSCLHAVICATLGLFVLLYFCTGRKDVTAEWKMMGNPRDWWCSGGRRGHCEVIQCTPLPPIVAVAPPIVVPPPMMVTAPMSYASLPRSHLSASAPPIELMPSEPEQTIVSKTSLNDKERDEAELLEKVCNLRSIVMPPASVVTEGSVSGMELFYNPHQLGVARKFFRKQRLMKRNNAAPVIAQSCAATSDAESLFSAGSKVNNTNIHHPHASTKLNNRVNRDPNLLVASPADFTTHRNVFELNRGHSPVSSISEARQPRSRRPLRARSADDLGEREVETKPRQPRQRARRRHRRGARGAKIHESSLASVTSLREPAKLSIPPDMYDSDAKKETCV